MRVAVVGLGGVGGYIAAKCKLQGIDVVGFARGEHKKAIEENKLQIIEDDTTYSVDLPLNDISKPFDIVLFCTKTYDLLSSIQQLKQTITPQTVCLSLSNGIDNHVVLAQHCNGIIAKGCIYILSHIQQPGVIRKKGNVFAVVFGDKGSDILETLFQKAQLRYKHSQNIQKDIWKKFIFISSFAMLTSYYNASIYEVITKYFQTTKAVLEEVANIAKTEGIDITKEIEKSIQTAQNLPKDATTSMHKDCKENKKTELKSLVGVLITKANKANVEIQEITKIYKELQIKCKS